jgi:hypothetical protein
MIFLGRFFLPVEGDGFVRRSKEKSQNEKQEKNEDYRMRLRSAPTRPAYGLKNSRDYLHEEER